MYPGATAGLRPYNVMRAVQRRTDEELVIEYGRSGDPHPLEVLIERHWDPALRFAEHLVGDPARAEDCVQEALCRMAAAAPRFRAGGGFWSLVSDDRRQRGAF